MTTAPTGIPRYRPTAAPVLFSEGFRPFFLGAAVWAALSLAVWLLMLMGWVDLPTGIDPIAWHAHEMIYGFAVAAMAGFLLTSIPNWTGRFPLQGASLVFLFLTWCAGRLAMATSGLIGALPTAIADMSFLALFLCAAAREIFAGRNWRNLPALIAICFLIIGNGLMHLEAIGISTTGGFGIRLGLAVFATLIALVGGRIIPSFTRNRLAKLGIARGPAGGDLLDKLALSLVPVALSCWVLDIAGALPGILLLTAGIATWARLARWQGLAIWRDALIFALHLGYAWLSLGLILLGLSQISPAFPEIAALHALGAGAIGTMIPAVMARATLAYTGRSQVASKATVALYVMLQGAALLRVAAAFLLEAHAPLVSAGGIAWIVAFSMFALFYGPFLLQPRVRRAAQLT